MKLPIAMCHEMTAIKIFTYLWLLARYCDFFMLTAVAAALDLKYSGSCHYNGLPIPSTSGRKLWCLYISDCSAETGYLNIPGTSYFLWSEHAPLVRQSSLQRIAGASDRMLCNLDMRCANLTRGGSSHHPLPSEARFMQSPKVPRGTSQIDQKWLLKWNEPEFPFWF